MECTLSCWSICTWNVWALRRKESKDKQVNPTQSNVERAKPANVKMRNNRRNKNTIQNVRVVDKDEGTDDIMCQRFLQAYNTSEGQIRVVLGYRGDLLANATATVGSVGFAEASGTDDFVSFTAQYQEFRIRAIRFDIYDVNPNSTPTTNYWSTFHTIGGTVPVDAESVIDRPDSRAISPGDGRATLAWVAHSIPEMAFQSTSTFNGLGGLSYYLLSSSTITGAKYSIVAKFIVDFRGRR